jgi:hypothetical protein
MENGRCRMHGGMVPRGIGLPQFKHGRYSKAVPKGLARAYEKAEQDPELVALRSEISLLTARIEERLRQTEKDPPPPWAEVVAAQGDLEDALRGLGGPGGREKVVQALTALKEVIVAGVDGARRYDKIWLDVRELIQERARVVAVESKRLAELDQTMTKAGALSLAVALLAAVKDSVPDLTQRAAVQRRFDEILNGRTAGLVVEMDMEVVTDSPAGDTEGGTADA